MMKTKTKNRIIWMLVVALLVCISTVFVRFLPKTARAVNVEYYYMDMFHFANEYTCETEQDDIGRLLFTFKLQIRKANAPEGISHYAKLKMDNAPNSVIIPQEAEEIEGMVGGIPLDQYQAELKGYDWYDDGDYYSIDVSAWVSFKDVNFELSVAVYNSTGTAISGEYKAPTIDWPKHFKDLTAWYKSENDRLTIENNSLKNDNASLRSENEQLELEVSSLTSQVENLTSQITVLNQTIAEKTAKISELENRISALNISIDFKVDEIASLRTSLANMTVDRDDYKTKYDDTYDKLLTAQGEKTLLENQVSDLTEELEILRGALSGDVQTLSKKLNEREKEIEQLNKKIKELEKGQSVQSSPGCGATFGIIEYSLIILTCAISYLLAKVGCYVFKKRENNK